MQSTSSVSRIYGWPSSALAVLLLLAATSMYAQDPPKKATSATPHSWSGFYVGVSGGSAYGSSDSQTSTTYGSSYLYLLPTSVPAVNKAGSISLHPHGFAGGLQSGYNWQANRIVLGFEAEFSSFVQNDGKSVTTIYPDYNNTLSFTIHSSLETKWLFTVRPRIGVTTNKALFYFTGGPAITELSGHFRFSDIYSLESASTGETTAGWAVGAGVERSLTSRWSIRAEYLRVHFGDVSASGFLMVNTAPTNFFNHNVNLNSDIFRLGVNYRL